MNGDTLGISTVRRSSWARIWGVFATPGTGRRIRAFIVVMVGLVVLWELYKVAWTAAGWSWPVRPDNTTMPHSWDIVSTLFRPARRGGEDLLIVILLRAALFTWREAFLGFVMGTAIGFGLGVVFVRSSTLERGLIPFVIASQTVPLLAIAPMVVIWGGRAGLERWVMVSVIAAYLTFFPVTINTLRGLRAPDETALELMRSYAAKPNDIMWKLRVPAALPYLFTALKISATVSVIGAIVGELPAGLGDGLGRALLNFASTFITSPEKLYASIIISALLGIVFVGLVTLAERLIVGERRLPA
jgi:NitT/TauT family transport system permease protein